MSGIRQAMAAGVVLFVLSKWDQATTFAKMGGMFLASLFHTSALLGIVFVVWESRLHVAYKVILAAIVLGSFYFIGGVADLYRENWEFYQSSYLTTTNPISSPGAKFHVVLIAFPALLYLLNKPAIDNVQGSTNLLGSGVLIAGCLVFLMFVSTTAASRLTVYLYYIPMTVYAAFPRLFLGSQRATILLGIVVAHFVILASWLLYANNSAAHIPYQNILLR
jgi:hypothetical protein